MCIEILQRLGEAHFLNATYNLVQKVGYEDRDSI